MILDDGRELSPSDILSPASVAAAIAGYFAILGNKLHKITIIFGELDHN